MKRRSCRRTWEAEAIGDGRLDPTARASFERHASGCAECRDRLQSLARIASALRTLPEYPIQSIDMRRGRLALIERANAYSMRGRAGGWRAWVFASIAGVAMVIAILAVRTPWLARVGGDVAPTFEVVDVGHATWKTMRSGSAAHVALGDGTAVFHVEHLTQRQRFLVDLPDGELEVRGTRFQITVADGHTKQVDVEEGVVALRLRGDSEVVLTAGAHWTAPQPIPSAAEGIANAAPGPGPSSSPPPPSAVTLAQAPRPAVNAHAPATDDAAAPVSKAVVGDLFSAGIRAFESSDYAGADHLLTTFLNDAPSDPRSEDAAFLRAVLHARMGDASGAARLARDYLRRYPHALRRQEAMRLAGSGESSRP